MVDKKEEIKYIYHTLGTNNIYVIQHKYFISIDGDFLFSAGKIPKTHDRNPNLKKRKKY